MGGAICGKGLQVFRYMKDYMKRDKLFYVAPDFIKKWPYPSRYAIGLNLDDFRAKDRPVFRFLIKGEMYEIDSWRANAIGRLYQVPNGVLPHLVPVEMFKKTKI